MTDKDVFAKLKETVLSFDEELALSMAEEVVKQGLDPMEAVDNGLIKGLDIIGEKYERDEIFLPELMMAASIFQKVMNILEPKIKEKGG